MLLFEMSESIPDFHRVLAETRQTFSLLDQQSEEAGLKHLQGHEMTEQLNDVVPASQDCF